MSFGIANGVLVQVKLVQNSWGNEVLNVFYFEYQAIDPADPASSTKALEAFKDAYVDEMLPRLSSQLYIDRAELMVMLFPDFQREILPIGLNCTGIAGSLPTNVSMGVRMVTGTRVVREGAKRFAGIPEDQVSGNTIASAYRASWQSLANGWVDGFVVQNDLSEDVGSFVPVVVSSKNWVDGEPTIWRAVQSYIVPTYVGSQNSRKEGRGS